MNELILGSTNCINADKAPWRNFKNPEAIYFSGSVITPCVVNVAVQTPRDLHYLHKAMSAFAGRFVMAMHQRRCFALRASNPLMGLLSEQNKKVTRCCR